MSGGQVSTNPNGSWRESMPAIDRAPGDVVAASLSPPRIGVCDILLEPGLLFAVVREEGRRLALIFLGVFLAGVGLWTVLPAKYTATALVMVDPREQRITRDPGVLQPYGKDAFALESLVEIAKSDGFLDTLLSRPDFRRIKEFARYRDVSELLDHMHRTLTISRRGLTYVIAVTFTASTAADAAQVANMVASAFVKSQSAVPAEVAGDATAWLGERTRSLREAVQKSDEAIAEYKSRRKLADLDQQTTIRQQQMADLTRKVAQAQLQAEAADARYSQAQREIATGEGAGLRSELLETLRQQRTQLYDTIAQKRAVLGGRHPELMVLDQQLAEINRQIARESQGIVTQAKSDRDTAQMHLASLQQEQKRLEDQLIADEEASSELKQWQIEAAANQTIFNQFLARFKLTSELRSLRGAEISLVSAAEPPARSTAPPARMILLIITLAAATLALMAVVLGRSSQDAR